MTKAYIGDDVYASDDGFHLILETQRENGTNTIYLKQEVLMSAVRVAAARGLINATGFGQAIIELEASESE